MLHYLLCLAPFFVCTFWAILFFRSKSDSRHSKQVMGNFMLVCALYYLTHTVFYSGDKLLFRYFDDLNVFVSLLIFPSYFLYIVNVTRENIHRWKFMWHYFPAFFFLILYVIFYLRLSPQEYTHFIESFLYAEDLFTIDIYNKEHQLGIVMILARVYYLLQILFYIILGLILAIKWKRRIKNFLSETTHRDIRLVEVLSPIGTILAIVGLFSDAIGRNLFGIDSIILLIPAFLFAPFIFMVGLIGYEQNYSFAELEEVERKAEGINVNESKVPPSKIRQELEILMQEKKIYLTPDLRISTLCEELRTNRTYLSQVLNEELNENFNSYINKHRVRYAIDLLKDKKWEHYSLDKFAELAGFGSTISMIRAFKQLTGKTPSEFRI